MTRWLPMAGQTMAAGVLAWGLLQFTLPRAPAPEPAPATVPALASQPAMARAAFTAGSDEHDSFRGAVRAAMPSVVNIYTATRMPARRGWLEQAPRNYGENAPPRLASLGSGVVWRADGYIVTNNHVVEGADEIAVVLQGRQPMRARVVGTDPESDLAVLRVEARDLPPIRRDAARALETGDVVLAIGNPFGVGQTVTQGIVSATGRNRLGINTFENFLQTDAAINPGNSGGALVDTRGHLVGINTAIFTQSEGSVGIGFAIPVHLVTSVAEELIAGGRVRRGWLGIQTQESEADVTATAPASPAGGVLVSAVESGGPAERAGLLPGDVIRAIDGKPVSDGASLVDLTATGKPGQRLSVQIDRRGTPGTLSVTLGERPLLRRTQR